MEKNTSPVPEIEGTIKMNFYEALKELMNGEKITRKEWGNEEEYGILKDGIVTIHKDDKFHNWIITDGDMKASDWYIIK